MADDLQETIENAAANPKATVTDGLAVTGHSLPELIEADRYLGERTAANGRNRGLRCTKLLPPGTV